MNAFVLELWGHRALWWSRHVSTHHCSSGAGGTIPVSGYILLSTWSAIIRESFLLANHWPLSGNSFFKCKIPLFRVSQGVSFQLILRCKSTIFQSLLPVDIFHSCLLSWPGTQGAVTKGRSDAEIRQSRKEKEVQMRLTGLLPGFLSSFRRTELPKAEMMRWSHSSVFGLTWYSIWGFTGALRSSPTLTPWCSLNYFYQVFCQYWNTSVAQNSLPPKTDCFIFCHRLNISMYYDGTWLPAVSASDIACGYPHTTAPCCKKGAEISVIKMHTVLFLLSLPEALGSVVGAGGSWERYSLSMTVDSWLTAAWVLELVL